MQGTDGVRDRLQQPVARLATTHGDIPHRCRPCCGPPTSCSPPRRRPPRPPPPRKCRCRRPSRQCRCQRPARHAQRPPGGPAATAHRWWAAPGARRSDAAGTGRRGRTAPAGGAAQRGPGQAGGDSCWCAVRQPGRRRQPGSHSAHGWVAVQGGACGRMAARTCLCPLRACRRSQSRTSLASSAKPSMRACGRGGVGAQP